MILLEEATKPLVITGLCLGALGLVSLWVALRARWARPPLWTLTYHGRSSAPLAHLSGAIGLCGAFSIPLSTFAPDFIVRLLSLVFVLGLISWFGGWLIWYPRFLTPLWYQRACRAGVDRHSPQAVQRFRELPVEVQKQLARTRGALPDGRDPRAGRASAVGTEGLEPPTPWV